MKDKKGFIGFKYAWNGIKEVLKTERNMRIHVTLFTIILIASIILRISTVEWLFVLSVSALVLTTEMINSVIERITDYLFPHSDERAKHMKDIAAGAVLIAAVFAAIVGLIIFLPKVF
ncbi:MAG TPA: diacylglycerol kinase family protein [Bacillota bacterium]|nr:diacylglycerol kinase family protein [Bacillota bacterium]